MLVSYLFPAMFVHTTQGMCTLGITEIDSINVFLYKQHTF